MQKERQKKAFLLIVDSDAKTKFLTDEIQQAYTPEIRILQNLDKIKESLDEKTWDLIVCDYKLDNKMQLLEILKDRSLDIPVIFISDSSGEETAVEAMLAGAGDYIKLSDPQRLIFAIERQLDKANEKKIEREIKAELERKEALLKITLSVAKMGIWEWDLRTNKVFLSPECQEVIGVEDSENFYEYYLSILTKGSEEIDRKVKEAIVKREDFYFDVEVNSPLKGRIWLAVFGRVEYDENGVPVKAVGVIQDITSLKEAEQKLRQSETQLKLITDEGSMMIVHLDRDLICRFANRSFCQTYNINPQDAIGKHFAELIGEEKFYKLLSGIQKALRGERFTCEEQMKTPQGKELYLTMEYVPYRVSENEVAGCLLFVTDNTTIRLAIEYLKESEERFSSLVKATNQVVWVGLLKDQGRIVTLFDSRYKIGSITERFHSNDYSKALEDLRRNAEAKSAYTAEYRIFHPEDNSYHVYSARAFPIFREGKVYEFIGTMTDVTEIQKAEKEVKFQAELLNMVQQAIVTTDTKGNILYWNKFAEFLFGWKVDEAKGRHVIDLLIPNEVVEIANKVASDVVKSNSSWSGELEMKRRDGSRFIASCNFSIASDEAGNKVVIGLIQDVTEKKEAEKRLQESIEQLRQAQKLESIGRLAGGIAHDFNNMLTAIKGYSELALRELGDEQGMLRRSIEEIKKAADRSSALTQQLLAFSRKQMIKTEVLDINQTIKETSYLLQQLVGEDMVVVLSLMSRRRFVDADSNQLSQVLVNLAVNSRDAMPDGGTIVIKTEDVYLDERFVSQHLEAKIGEYVKISFRDNGCGMDEETLKHIFEPFFTTKPVGKGTGLGLSMVYGIIKQLNGFILCKSELGKGTTFEIFLPISRKSPETMTTQEKDVEAKVTIGNILLVEDEDIVRALTKELLESCGYKVFDAKNAKEALLICDVINEKLDLLISDVVMPRMNGYELAMNIREKIPQLPVLFVSGYVTQVENFRRIQDERAFFIQKPFSYDSLTKAVAEIIQKTRQQPR